MNAMVIGKMDDIHNFFNIIEISFFFIAGLGDQMINAKKLVMS